MRTWPPYQTLRPLIHAHVGRTAVIMGGGPTLIDAMRIAPAEALYISANDHGCRLFKNTPGETRQVSYIVACDKIEFRVRPFAIPIIGRHMWADYRLLFMPGPSSGMAAAWAARFMGCAPIILTGMDFYTGGTYHDDPQAASTGKNIAAKSHAVRWQSLVALYPAQYRTIGCYPGLANRLGIYDPKERAAPPIAREQLLKELRSEHVRLKIESMISMRIFPAGAQLELHVEEAKKLFKTRRAERWAGATP